MPKTVARLIAESLQAHDIDLVYCVPGESYLGLTDALSDMNSVRLTVCRHEGGAAFMAVADGRLRDRAGVAVVSRGPGLSNAMVALHTAFHDATPMVILVGQVERKDYGRLALQEQNYTKLLADVTKGVIEVNEPVMASEAIARLPFGRKRHAGPRRGRPARRYLQRASGFPCRPAAPPRLSGAAPRGIG